MSEGDFYLTDLNSIKFNLEYEQIGSNEYLNFNDFQYNNEILETIHLKVLDINDEMNIIENINKFIELKVFIVYEDCLLENENLIKLMLNLSILDSLF